MDGNLLDTVMRSIPHDTVNNAATTMGESHVATERAVRSSIPAILAGCVHLGSTESGLSRLLSIIGDEGLSRAGGSALSSVFGNRLEGLSAVVADHAGVRPSSALAILASVFPLVLGAIGRTLGPGRLDARNLGELLLSQKKNIVESPDAPTGLAGALGLSRLSDLGGRAADFAQSAPTTPAAKLPAVRTPDLAHRDARRGWIVGAVALCALALWGLSALGHRHEKVATEPVGAPSQEAPRVQALAPEPSPAPVHITGAQVPAPSPAPSAAAPTSAAGPVADLARALTDNSVSLPRTFRLEPLSFAYASSTPTDRSKGTIDELARTLAAHPSARIRLVGFTDSTGGADGNASLSSERAKTVEQMLVAHGVAANRIATEGRSDRDPVASNETHEGRLDNRRVEVVLESR
jgi:OOP family OmpA-OmpF porin